MKSFCHLTVTLPSSLASNLERMAQKAEKRQQWAPPLLRFELRRAVENGAESWSMHTFRHRLTAALAGSSAAFLSILCVVLYFWCRSAFLADLDSDLEAIFRADFAAVTQQGASLESTIPKNSDESHVFKLLLHPDGSVISQEDRFSQVPHLEPQLLQAALESGGIFSDLEFHGNLYRTLANPIRLDTETVIEVLGISQEPMQDSLVELRRMLAVSFLIGIVLVAMVSYRVAAYLTSPLEHILAQLESVTSRGDPGLRLVGRYQDNEMVSLQEQVNAMLERLEMSFRSQRQFISNASHELRAPLANLTLALDVCLRRPRETEEYRETLVTCLGETQRLTEMSNQLLQLSKADEGALLPTPEAMEIQSLVEQSVARKAVAALSKQVELRIEGSKVAVFADPLMLGQVLDNLLDNAIRHSPPGTSVLVTSQAVEDFAEFSVVDAGPGMTREQVEHIFERFYRADASRQRDTGGAGLGLAISQAIAEAHGGLLTVESRPGEGTTFTLRIPKAVGTHNSGEAASNV